MRKVYVSSTYEDLKEARARVRRAIRRHPDYVAIGMEDYTAYPEPPLDKCLADARDCDVYIGLLGSRSGYVPPQQTKSITFLEFEAARLAGKPCLFFLFPTTAVMPRADPTDSIRSRPASVHRSWTRSKCARSPRFYVSVSHPPRSSCTSIEQSKPRCAPVVC